MRNDTLSCIIAVSGLKRSGKTTVAEALVSEIASRGCRGSFRETTLLFLRASSSLSGRASLTMTFSLCTWSAFDHGDVLKSQMKNREGLVIENGFCQ
jgi:cytidylate kinase